MRRESLDGLPVLNLPDGFELRTFRLGDEARWAQLMTGAIGDWNEQSTTRQFLGDPGVSPGGIFFFVEGDNYIATATDKVVADSKWVTSTWWRWDRHTDDGA